MQSYLPPTFLFLVCSKPFVLVKHFAVSLELTWNLSGSTSFRSGINTNYFILPVRYFYTLCLSSLQKACRNLFWHRILAFQDSRSFLFWWEKAWCNNLPLCLIWEIHDIALTTYSSLYSHWWQSFHWIIQNYWIVHRIPKLLRWGPGFFFDSLLGQTLRTELRSLTLCRVMMCLFLKTLKKYCVLIMQVKKNPPPRNRPFHWK